MIPFLRKKVNRSNKIVFINETNLKPKGRIAFQRCPGHGVLYVVTDIKNFQTRSERLLPSDFFDYI